MFDQFLQLPKGVKVVFGGLSSLCLLAVAALIDTRALVVVAVGLVLVVIAVLLWVLWQRWQRRQRAKALQGQLATHSAAAPSAVSDPAHRAKLDDLRQSFGRGLEKFRAAGKDLYSLPWYVVCGEPGSGKTEAVRHCNVGFPPGLQDEMQGAGGTINMHWWFTNHAVLIDTAGKLLFQEAPAGTTTEWSEFLKLLRKARPNCPINGLLLVIPSESLIRDSFEEIQRKAGKIAQQLDTIQRTLDVRFPVFVLVTKCDLINGFREFFTGVKDPQLQHQMTGWSNPDPLDTPFQPEAIDQHLSAVVQRISRRRLGLLRDPIPADAGKRRVDEVDALFALPASISALAPRLRRYLETIFVAGVWSAKPLFLRGIYFTSALTEGAALDAELANALGIPVEQLPEGKAWERERSFFLRDLFVQKIFKERGLVTRASNTSRLVRRRQFIIGSVVGLGLLALVVVSLLGHRALRSSVGAELAYWKPAARAEAWTGGRWLPIVNGGLDYTGDDVIKLDDGEQWSVAQFHDFLQERVSRDLEIPWVFRPVESLAMRANPGRRNAQRVLFEASVVGPLVDANRERLVNATGWASEDADRLAALIQLEGAIHLKGIDGYDAEYSAEDFFNPLLGPSLAKVRDGQAVLGRMMQIFEWTYFRGGAGRGQWPGRWLSRGKGLRDNQPLLRGWDALERSVQETQAAQRDAFRAIQDGRLVGVRFTDAERAFLKTVMSPRTNTGWKDAVVAAGADLAGRRSAMDALVVDLKAKTGLTGEVTLDGAYRAIGERVRAEAGRASERVRAALRKQHVAAVAAEKASSGEVVEFTLYRDLQRRMSGLDVQIKALLEQLLPASEQAQLADIDAQTLRLTGGGVAAYGARSQAYAEAIRIMNPSFADGGSLLGRLADTVGQQNAALSALRDSVAKYDGVMQTEFGGAMRQLLDAAAVLGVNQTLDAYGRELDATLDAAGYPFGAGPVLAPDQLAGLVAALDKTKADMAAKDLPAEARMALESRFARAGQMAAFAAQLLGADGRPVTAKLVLVRDRDQAGVIERTLRLPADPRQALARVYPSMRIAGRNFRPRGLPQDTEVQKLSVAAPLPRMEFFTTPDPRPQADAVLESDPGWGVLRLLQQGAVRRAEGKEWDTALRLRDGDTDLVLAVTVVFDQPLPPLDRWPIGAR